MLDLALVVVLGLSGGLAVGVQSPMAGAMGSRIGGAAGSFILHLSGTIASLVLLIARGGENIHAWRSLPWYMLCSGVFGLVLILTLSQTVPKLGAASAITLVVVGQLVGGLLIDHFGFFDVTVRPVDLQRIAAVTLLLAGAYLMVR
ncbi:DMT family transporter [Tropicimonas sp. TH_r6]|uniref:DMT family transporter n=1 Tax=Tropicimonas sp. TH_r6 TaxID=3082085 RepID=UPI002953719A|nr:DMT family transporter [Tropicimonas sp. TH_r6]MDV7141866.1 DMT family transporter [Tropicimonas sp. TH_r6]